MVTFNSLSHAEDLQQPETGKKIKVFLFAGQSNMEGRAHGRKLTEEDRERLSKVQNRIQFAFNHEPIRPLDVSSPPEVIRKIYKRDRIFGPELFFGMTLAEEMPDEKFLFIKLAVGGTSLLGCWNPDWDEKKAKIMNESKHPKLYGDFISYVREVLKGYSPEEYEMCGMLWVQGEKDGKVPDAEAAYGKILHTLIHRVRQDLRDKNLPFILFQVGSLKVIQGMQTTANTLSNVTLIAQSQNPGSPDFYEKMKNGHYNVEGMKKLGMRFAEVYLQTYVQIK